MKIQARRYPSISAPNRPSAYLLPRFLPSALRYFQPSSPQDIETERDTVTGKVRNAKDKKKSIFQRHEQMYQLNYPFFAEWTRYMDWNIFSFF
jgi:hypothetical protein